MAEPRKVFRIEETAAARRRRSLDATPASLHNPVIKQALVGLRAAAAAPTPAPSAKLANDKATPRGGSGIAHFGIEAAHLTRIAHELDAVVNGTAQATQKILTAAEEIDQAANNLSAALKGKIEQGQAQDIRDLLIGIFEACNFQDLIGQRVGKVMATLKVIEDHITHVLAEMTSAAPAAAHEEPQYLHGPRLDFDHGHVTQTEIDAMFDG